MGKIYGGGSFGQAQDGTGGGEGGVPEAPIDGVLYGRQDANWTPIVDVTGIPEAPTDGQMYVRQNGAWVVMPVAQSAVSLGTVEE